MSTLEKLNLLIPINTKNIKYHQSINQFQQLIRTQRQKMISRITAYHPLDRIHERHARSARSQLLSHPRGIKQSNPSPLPLSKFSQNHPFRPNSGPTANTFTRSCVREISFGRRRRLGLVCPPASIPRGLGERGGVMKMAPRNSTRTLTARRRELLI